MGNQFIPPEGIAFYGCQRSTFTIFSQVPMQPHWQHDPWVVGPKSVSFLSTTSSVWAGYLTLILTLQRDQNRKLNYMGAFHGQILSIMVKALQHKMTSFPLSLQTHKQALTPHKGLLGEKTQAEQQPMVISSRVSIWANNIQHPRANLPILQFR